MSKSRLISIEGIEGCGKSTLIESLKNILPTTFPQKKFHFFREPGTTSWGEKVREVLLNADLKRSPMSEVFLFLAARAELIQQHLLPLLKNDENVVILDRYSDSTYVYQGYCQGLDIQELQTLHKTKALNLPPQLTLYLRIDAATSLERQKIRANAKDYFEQWSESKVAQLVNGFDAMAKAEPGRMKIISASENKETVLNQALALIKDCITK